MQFYSKMIAAIVGILALLVTRYGVEVDDDTQKVIIDGLIGLATVGSVYFLKNKPTTPAQVEVARDVASEGAKDVREGS